jgi:hypothetical protein
MLERHGRHSRAALEMEAMLRAQQADARPRHRPRCCLIARLRLTSVTGWNTRLKAVTVQNCGDAGADLTDSFPSGGQSNA